MKIKIDGITSLPESNRFLRSLWAELRKEHSRFGWNYQPFKDGASQTIFLGWGNGIPISLSYSQKSIVNGICFGEDFNESIDELSESGRKLKRAVDAAVQNYKTPETKALAVLISSSSCSLAPYRGQWFKVSPRKHPLSLLTIKVRAFDIEDAKTEFLRVSSFILDIFSVETNGLFWTADTNQHETAETEIDSSESNYPAENTYLEDEDWIDTYPSINKFKLISSHAIKFIDHILSKDDLSSNEDYFARACHHYHMARGQDAFCDNFVLIDDDQLDNLTPFNFFEEEEVLSKIKMAHIFNRRATEIATVLYMSAIEVASMIDSKPPEKCKSCGQDQYKISARVADYVNKFQEEGYLSKAFKSFYSKRSKYLHAGAPLSNHAYIGVIIPKLDPSSDSGVSEMTSIPLINLREWTGYMLRQQLRSMYFEEPPNTRWCGRTQVLALDC